MVAIGRPGALIGSGSTRPAARKPRSSRSRHLGAKISQTATAFVANLPAADEDENHQWHGGALATPTSTRTRPGQQMHLRRMRETPPEHRLPVAQSDPTGPDLCRPFLAFARGKTSWLVSSTMEATIRLGVEWLKELPDDSSKNMHSRASRSSGPE